MSAWERTRNAVPEAKQRSMGEGVTTQLTALRRLVRRSGKKRMEKRSLELAIGKDWGSGRGVPVKQKVWKPYWTEWKMKETKEEREGQGENRRELEFSCGQQDWDLKGWGNYRELAQNSVCNFLFKHHQNPKLYTSRLRLSQTKHNQMSTSSQC